MTALSIEEKDMIVDRGCVTYVGELGRGFKQPISIHISRWCVIDYLVEWDVEVDML